MLVWCPMGIMVSKPFRMIGKARKWIENIDCRWVMMLMSEFVTTKNSFDY